MSKLASHGSTKATNRSHSEFHNLPLQKCAIEHTFSMILQRRHYAEQVCFILSIEIDSRARL